jgi:Cupin domain
MTPPPAGWSGKQVDSIGARYVLQSTALCRRSPRLITSAAYGLSARQNPWIFHARIAWYAPQEVDDMGKTQVLAGGVVAALMVMVVLAGLARATSPSGTSSSLVGPPATYSPFKVKRQRNDWEVEVEAKQGLTIATQTITFAPGAQSGWHSHPGPVFISVREGTMTFYEEDCTSTVRTVGEGFLDTGSHAHLARNESGAPATNVVTYFAPPHTPSTGLRIDQPQPLTCAL